MSREHRRAKTDRLDAAMLMRVFLGWLRGERGHCGMVAIPTLEEEDAKRPSREREKLGRRTHPHHQPHEVCLAAAGHPWASSRPSQGAEKHRERCAHRKACRYRPTSLDELRRDLARLACVREQIATIESERLDRLEAAPRVKTERDGPAAGPHRSALASRRRTCWSKSFCRGSLRDRRAVARYAGLTGSPDESGAKRREKGLAKSGNARVRRGLIQLAWRFLMFQKESALARWYRQRTEGVRRRRKTMIVALARKLLIAFWRMVTTGEVPEGVVLRPVIV